MGLFKSRKNSQNSDSGWTSEESEKKGSFGSSSDNSGSDTPSEPESGQQEPERKGKLAKLESSQMWSPIKDIKDGVIITKDGRYVQVLEFAPINYALLPEREREQIADTFGSAIRLFPPKFQIKVISRQANVESHIRDLYSCYEKEKNPRCKTMQEHSIQQIRQTASTGISRRFLVSYEYEMPKGLRRPSWDEIRSTLNFTGQQIAAIMGSPPCNNALLSDIGDSDHALDILYECMCRAEAEIKPLDEKIADIVCAHMLERGYRPDGAMTIPINDFLAPKRIDPSSFSYIEVDGKYYCFGYIDRNSYPTRCYAGWLSALINLGEGIDVDIWVDQKPTKEIQTKLTYSMQLSRSDYAHKSAASADLVELENKIQSESYIRAALSNDQSLCYFAIMLTVVADSPEELKAKFKEVSNKLINMNLDLRVPYGSLDLAFRSSLPLCAPHRAVTRYAWRNIMSGDFGAAYPFTSYEINDPGGIMLGRNRRNNSPLFMALFNRHLYNNGNMVIFGSTGAGKTFSLQCMALRLRQYQTQVIIIAPYKGDEYSRACAAIGGSFITLAPGSPHNINIMEIRRYDTTNREAIVTGDASSGSILMTKIQQLQTFFSLLKKDITDEEKHILDDALLETYRKYGITEKNKSLIDPRNPSRYKKMPILGDLDDQLRKVKGATALRTALARFITGSAQNFNGPTNVNLDNEYIVIDVSNMTKEMIPIAIFIATDFVYDTIRANPFKAKAIVMDELSKMIGISGTPESADFVMRLYKTVRSYKTIIVSATQDLNDFFALNDGWYGKGILANAKIKFIMKTEEAEVPTITEALRLSQSESDQLVYFDRGEGLLIANRNHTDIKIVASPIEHALITTDPEELERLYGNKSG